MLTSSLLSASVLMVLRCEGDVEPCRGAGSGESPRSPALWDLAMGLPVRSAAVFAELCWLLHSTRQFEIQSSLQLHQFYKHKQWQRYPYPLQVSHSLS